jgi:hypothetical protein
MSESSSRTVCILRDTSAPSEVNDGFTSVGGFKYRAGSVWREGSRGESFPEGAVEGLFDLRDEERFWII